MVGTYGQLSGSFFRFILFIVVVLITHCYLWNAINLIFLSQRDLYFIDDSDVFAFAFDSFVYSFVDSFG